MKNSESLKPYFYNKSEVQNSVIELFDSIESRTHFDLKMREEKIIQFLEEHAKFYHH
jgi:hypothetical protein